MNRDLENIVEDISNNFEELRSNLTELGALDEEYDESVQEVLKDLDDLEVVINDIY